MPTFRYEATNAKGKRRRDSVEAPDMETAIASLRERGLSPVVVKELDFTQRSIPEGPSPPLPPREVGGPWGFRILFGLPFLLVGLAALVGLVVSREPQWILFALIFGGVGGFMTMLGLKTTQRWRRVVRDGQATVGAVTATGYDGSMQLNGRPAYRLRYSYEANGVRHDGKVSTFARATVEYSDGDVLWVLFDPHAPSISAPWPPLRPA